MHAVGVGFTPKKSDFNQKLNFLCRGKFIKGWVDNWKRNIYKQLSIFQLIIGKFIKDWIYSNLIIEKEISYQLNYYSILR